jgi:hypothetical protein
VNKTNKDEDKMTTIDKNNKEYQHYLTLRKKFKKPVKFKACPEAMNFLGYGTVKLSEVAPISREFTDGVRIDGVDDSSVRTFMDHIQNGTYDPIADIIDPPCVVAIPKNTSAYKKGYRYRMSDGFTRCEAHRRLKAETMEVAFIEFKEARGESANYWMIAFMIEKNDETQSTYHRKSSNPADQVQQARLLITDSMKNNPPIDLEDLKAIFKDAIKLSRIRKKSLKEDVWIFAINLFNKKNPNDTLGDIVHPYTKQSIAEHVHDLCTVEGIQLTDVLTRKIDKEDRMASRFDFDQVDYLINIGMENPKSLKDKRIVGVIVGADYQHEVKEARARKSCMISFYIDRFLKQAEWLKKNRKLVEEIPVLFLSQTSDDPTEGSIFTVDPNTGNAVTVKNEL